MDFKKVQSFIKYFESSKLTMLSVEEGKFKISLSKLSNPLPTPHASSPVATTPVASTSKDNAPAAISTSTNNGSKTVEESLIKPITSPLVGTYYASSSPTAEPFVKTGQKVNKGQTVCIIEAMKIMNEITSPFTGVIEKINVKNGDVIGFNQPIMTVRPQE